MVNVVYIMLLNKYSILFTSCVNLSEQYLGYYVKYGLMFNVRGSKIESHKKKNEFCLCFSEAF